MNILTEYPKSFTAYDLFYHGASLRRELLHVERSACRRFNVSSRVEIEIIVGKAGGRREEREGGKRFDTQNRGGIGSAYRGQGRVTSRPEELVKSEDRGAGNSDSR